MDFKKLRSFVEVVGSGSFRRAAQSLNIAQPALTRQIQALEADLGVPLLHRSKAGVVPTLQGRLLLDEAQEILARTNALRDLVTSDGAPKGHVHLGLPSALADDYLGTLVETVRAKFPAVQIICREGAADLIERAEDGVLDLAIASVVSVQATYRCHVQYLLEEQDYLVGLDRICPARASLSIEELLSMPLVLTPLPNARRLNLQQLASRRHMMLDVITEAATLSTQRDLVLRGLGFAVLPYSAARSMARDCSIKIMPIDGLHSHRALFQNMHSRNAPAVERVRQEVASLFNRLGPELSDRNRTGTTAAI